MYISHKKYVYLLITSLNPLTREGKQYMVKLGEHDLAHDNENVASRVRGDLPSSLYKVESLRQDATESTKVEQLLKGRFILYPEYHHFKYYDIALIALEKPVGGGVH